MKKKQEKCEGYLGHWHMGNVALFGAILMSHGVSKKDREFLKKQMLKALKTKSKPMERDTFFEEHPELCS